ncbi:MAG: hypothetical protein NT085_01185 [candidate division SR1 bacterium]|nr:hypothetical protein [candidate division SR1 bacterium]
MEPNQVNPSPENAGIPQGIPTGVFVANNQVPAQTSVQNTVSVEPTQASTGTPVVSQAAPVAKVQPSEGALDNILKGIVRFFAKIMGQPDPITGALNPTSSAAKKADTLVGKVRGAANQVVSKASDVAGKAVNTVNQATEKIQQVIPQQPVVPTTPVEPVQPVQPIPPVQA